MRFSNESMGKKYLVDGRLGMLIRFLLVNYLNLNVNIRSHSSELWQTVIWTSDYYIWKEMNSRVFKKKVSSTNKIVQDIQLKSFEWIVRRSKKKQEMNWQHWLFDPIKCRIHG